MSDKAACVLVGGLAVVWAVWIAWGACHVEWGSLATTNRLLFGALVGLALWKKQ